MIRLGLGILLLPLSASMCWVAAKTLAAVAARSSAAAPFSAGLGLCAAAWLAARGASPGGRGAWSWGGRAVRWTYVLGHELTHALAAWALGGKVFDIRVSDEGGHADLSRAGTFVSLAPYCFPLYAAAVLAGYRLLLWARPEAGGEALFLFLLGGALGFHLLLTWEALTEADQPDLRQAGGRLFSWTLITAANAALVLGLLKALFPSSVPALARLREAAGLSRAAWGGAWSLARPAVQAARRSFPR